MKKAEQREERTPHRNPRKRAPAGQLAELLKCAKLPKVHNIHFNLKTKAKIIPLDGLEQIGIDVMTFECNDTTIVVDCGIAFSSKDTFSTSCVIPNIGYLEENQSKVRDLAIAHGHENHIGALPYILKKLNVPVYSTKLIVALICHKLEEYRFLDSVELSVAKYGDTVSFGDLNVESIKTNHSISDSSAFAIFSPAGIIFYMGDFKIGYTSVLGEMTNLQHMAELDRHSVLATLCGSINIIRPGFTMFEKMVGRTFDLIFVEHQENRIIIVTFASNVGRIQQIISSAYRYGRKVVIRGRSMVDVIGIVSELGYIEVPKDTPIEIDQLRNYPPEKTALTTTGSQGESMAALPRMASGIHRKVTISPSDMVIMSPRPIPGNEKAVDKVINELSIKGVDVIFQDTRVSGHACVEEIKLMYSLLRPKFALLVHGKYCHRKAQVEIAEVVGVPKGNIPFISTGDVVTLAADSCKIAGYVQVDGILVDGLGAGDIGNVVLCDRQNLAQNSIMVVTIGLQRGSNQPSVGLEIMSRGLVYVKDSGDLMVETREWAMIVVTDNLNAGVSGWSKSKSVARDGLSDFFWKKMKRTPVILPIILGVN